MKVKLRPRFANPLWHVCYTQTPLRATMVAVCALCKRERERRQQACRIATSHWHSRQAKVFPTDDAVAAAAKLLLLLLL